MKYKLNNFSIYKWRNIYFILLIESLYSAVQLVVIKQVKFMFSGTPLLDCARGLYLSQVYTQESLPGICLTFTTCDTKPP